MHSPRGSNSGLAHSGSAASASRGVDNAVAWSMYGRLSTISCARSGSRSDWGVSKPDIVNRTVVVSTSLWIYSQSGAAEDDAGEVNVVVGVYEFVTVQGSRRHTLGVMQTVQRTLKRYVAAVRSCVFMELEP